jgi:hypothetical protein
MAYIVNATVTEVEASSVTLTKPTGVTNGDVLIAVMGSAEPNNGDPTLYAPSGFVTIRRTSTSDRIDRQTWTYYKLITDAGSEPASYTWTAANNVPFQCHLILVRGADTSDLIEASDGTRSITLGGDITSPSITTLKDNCLILSCALTTNLAGTPQPTISTPTGFTRMADLGIFPEGDQWVYQLVAWAQQPTAGATGVIYWPIYSFIYDDVGITIAINSLGGGSSSSAACDNDCGTNQLCTGHVPVCSNDFTFESVITTGTIVRAFHIEELQTAIDLERTDAGRRFNASDPAYCDTHTPGDVACSSNEFSGYSWDSGVVSGGIVLAQHFDDLKEANNEVVTDSGYGTAISTTFAADGIIYAADITDLQTKINATRNACICDSHCNCDPSDCGCDGECTSDSYYYYSSSS